MWQEDQVTSSVTTPPEFQLNHFPMQPTTTTTNINNKFNTNNNQQQQYYSSENNDEHFDPYNLQSQVRLLFDVQS